MASSNPTKPKKYTKEERDTLLIWDVGFGILLLIALWIGDWPAFLGGLAGGLYFNWRFFNKG